ncbi:cell division cycle-associated protein 2 isoform X1 [Hemitrygon akajei]|uniref:cell division cycle-associated protein 2 isoform X1 n=2 Tax=Hemitrygon akajei TaxID=2704970 RepID=UPI003BF989F4
MDDRPVGVNRNSKYDLFSKDLGLAREYCLLEMYKNNEIITKNLKNAISSLNENSACDVNMMKRYVGVFNESDRFEDENLENLPLGSAKLVVEQNFERQDSLHLKEIRAKRNVPGKRKPRAGTLCEIKLPSVENLDQTTDKLSSRQLLLANNSYSTVQTLDERKMLKLNNLANPRPGSQQESICQEASFKATDVDVPIPAPLELGLHSKDLTLNDQLPCKPVTWESEGSTIVPSFPTTPSGCATTSRSDSENCANRYWDYLMNMDEEQSNSRVTKTPSPSLDTLINTGGNWEMTEEMFNLNSAGKFSAGRKRFSRRASSVGARGSPETNSLICYIAKQKMQESQRVSVLKSKITAFMDTFQAAEQDANKSSTAELPDLPGLSQTSSKEQKSILSTSCSKPQQKKKVTFGEALSPELFDERLPSNTPLRKGESPAHQRLTFGASPPSVLKQRSKAQIVFEEEKSASTDVACNGCSPVNDHGDSISIKLQTKLEDDIEISATGTQNDDEDRCRPIAIDFEIESPRSECNVGPDNLKSCDKSDEYLCEVLEMKIQEMNGIVPLAISPSGCPEEGSNAAKGRNLTKKKDDCIRKKLLKIKPEPDKKITTVNKLKISEIERESEIESDMDHIPSEVSKLGDGFLDQNNTDLSINDVQTNSIAETCPKILSLSEQGAENEDKKVCSEALDADVSSNPTIKPKEKVKTKKVEQESKKEEPRRSTRIKNNANNISKGSTRATKEKYRQKFKKDLYGKREYASKKPLLSPIAEILDIWSESADLSDSDEMSTCEPSRRNSLLYLEGIDVGRKGSQCMSTPECITDRCAPASLTELVGQRARGRGRPRKRPVHCIEEEQNNQSDSESKTPKGNTGVCQFVPKKSNQSNYSLKSGSGPSPSLCEGKKDIAFEVKELKISRVDNVTKDRKPTNARRKSSIKIKNKYFSKEPSPETSRQGMACAQNLSAGRGVTEAGLEEYSEQVHADDYNGVGSLLESGSNILEDFNVHQLTDPSETQELTPVSTSTAPEKSQVTISEPVANGITVLEEKDLCIFLPDAQEVFLSRPSHRRSKLFSAADLPCMTESEQALEGKGHCVIDAGDEYEDKDQNLSGRVEGDSCNMIPESAYPNQQMFTDGVGESHKTTNCEPLFFSFDLCLEQKKSNIFEAAKQFETGIKCSDGFLQNAKPVKKKVRRSARLSGCMNKEGLTWIDVKSPGHLQERNATARLSRRSLGLIESESKLPSAEDVASKTASQASIRILYRRSLSCNREKVFKLEEPHPKSIILD